MKRSFVRRGLNTVLGLLAEFVPGSESLRPILHRMRGVNISGHVFIGQEVILENEYPECIEIRDGAHILLRSALMAHFRGRGRIIVDRKAWIGPACYVSARGGRTVTIGEGSVLAAGSVVIGKNVAAYTMVGGVPAKPIARVTVPLDFGTTYDDFKKGLVPLDK